MINLEHDIMTSTELLRKMTDGKCAMLGCAFLSSYPVLALGFNVPQHEALIRNLPLSLRAKFSFAAIMTRLNLDWTSLAHVVEVTVTESSIRIVRRNSRRDGGFFDVFFSEETNSLLYIVHDIFEGICRAQTFCKAEKWSERLELMHNSILAVEEADQMFVTCGWKNTIESLWNSPKGDCICRLNWDPDGNVVWDFWAKRLEDRARVVDFLIHCGSFVKGVYIIGPTEHYADWKYKIAIDGREELPRREWFSKLYQQIEALSEIAEVKNSPKRQKIEV